MCVPIGTRYPGEEEKPAPETRVGLKGGGSCGLGMGTFPYWSPRNAAVANPSDDVDTIGHEPMHLTKGGHHWRVIGWRNGGAESDYSMLVNTPLHTK